MALTLDQLAKLYLQQKLPDISGILPQEQETTTVDPVVEEITQPVGITPEQLKLLQTPTYNENIFQNGGGDGQDEKIDTTNNAGLTGIKGLGTALAFMVNPIGTTIGYGLKKGYDKLSGDGGKKTTGPTTTSGLGELTADGQGFGTMDSTKDFGSITSDGFGFDNTNAPSPGKDGYGGKAGTADDPTGSPSSVGSSNVSSTSGDVYGGAAYGYNEAAEKGNGDNSGSSGCVIATHAVNSGAFTKDTKREAVRWCVKNLHRTWWGEAVRKGYRYYGQKAIEEGNAKNHYQEFKDYVAFGTGKRRTLKTGWTFVYRTVQFFLRGLTL